MKIYKLDEGDFRVYSATRRELSEPSNPYDPTYLQDKKEELKCLLSRFVSSYEVRN